MAGNPLMPRGPGAGPVGPPVGTPAPGGPGPMQRPAVGGGIPSRAGGVGAPLGGGPVSRGKPDTLPRQSDREGRTANEQQGKLLDERLKVGVRAQGVLDHLRTELDQLMDMGDMIRPESVIEAAGRLVGHGIGATQMAALMSDMPAQGGDGLASWIRMHDVRVGQAEMQLAQENDLVRHQLMMAGVRMMAEEHVAKKMAGHMANMQAAAGPMGPQGAAPSPPNGLGGTSPDEGGGAPGDDMSAPSGGGGSDAA